MATRSHYNNGIFNWVDLCAHDTDKATAFYHGLFGWQEERMPVPGDTSYNMQRLEGKDVCAIFPMPQPMTLMGIPSHWQTYISVSSLDQTLGSIKDNGGMVMTGPMDVMGAGRMATVVDPTGAMFQCWEPILHHGATLVNQPNTWIWNELLTRDLEKSKGFYHKVFGWEYESADGIYTVIHHDGMHRGGMMTMPQEIPSAIPSHWGVYFNVVDLKKALETAKELGGVICKEPFDTAFGPIAVIKDTQGAMVNLIQCEQWDE